MSTRHVAFLNPVAGMDGISPPEALGQTAYGRSVNATLSQRMLRTRPGFVIRKAESPDANSAAYFAAHNLQGAKFFNPAKGQGAIIFTPSNALILVACGGRKFALRIKGRGAALKCTVEDVTGDAASNQQLHLAWWGAWENYALCQDGQGPCWIWDGVTAARTSSGYHTTEKESSEVPNGGSVLAYSHGRGVAVVNSRFVLVGNQLNMVNLTTAEDLLKFTEQAYWATGQYFVPPSVMGNILAAEILPIRNTQHGHGELMLHCEDGVFSIDLNVYPRSDWFKTPMVKTALSGTGACGPYALGSYDGDQMFRSRHGIQTLRSSAAESSRLGNPQSPISRAVDTWLASDYPLWLRFASLLLWTKNRRMFCTTSPVVQGRFRSHRGIVVMNFDPAPAQDAPAAWEGLWTLPSQASGIVQMVSGLYDGDERAFALCRGADGVNRIAEFSESLSADVLEDGAECAIASQVITRALDNDDLPLNVNEFLAGTIFFRDITRATKWQVFFRTFTSPTWKAWANGEITLEAGDNPCDIAGEYRGQANFPLGNLPKDACGKSHRWVQFLIKWQGCATVESLGITSGLDVAGEDVLKACAQTASIAKAQDAVYDDYEYSL